MSIRVALSGLVAGLLIVCGCEKGVPDGEAPGDPQAAGKQASEAQADTGPEVLKVKGLYVGMSLDEAREQLARTVEGTTLAERWTPTWQKKRPDSPNRLQIGDIAIMSDPEKRVKKILLGPRAVEELFNAKGIPAEEFVQTFTDSHGIPKPERCRWQRGPNSPVRWSWKYISSHGYRLVIYENKSIEIRRTWCPVEPPAKRRAHTDGSPR